MHRIPQLVALPDQIETLARELESEPLNIRQLQVINDLRASALDLAHNIEAHRMIWRCSTGQRLKKQPLTGTRLMQQPRLRRERHTLLGTLLSPFGKHYSVNNRFWGLS